MKKILLTVIMSLILIQISFAASPADITVLDVQMPKEVSLGDEFDILISLNSKKELSGFEFEFSIPSNSRDKYEIISVTDNAELRTLAGQFYETKYTKSSVKNWFILTEEPITGNHHILTVKVKTLHPGTFQLNFKSTGADTEGNEVPITQVSKEITVSGNLNSEDSKSENAISRFINYILSFFFGG
ncbi:hypothetical protein Mevan_0134 [Methanococcus vannielii SB]|uniref:Cellulosome anchoring protein cohesin region n=1 Tax=Methanococcus vannielii (strain ATCC 35089 / DSM 1224 / JCM 13029 / OCM 148 / SB) TaxID=406327 RepID=A6UNH3_METVS|nr:hypothetical protein [Methanococcus vannielii]ABR54045.1 hypothetical protein Mevan_0134 [Methanococcus vannielii SB]